MTQPAQQALRAPIARRLFLFFLLSAFVPLAAIGLLSFAEVRGMLAEQAELRLARLAKSYATAIFERLAFAADIGSAAADSPGAGAADSMATRAFRSLFFVEANGVVRAIIGEAKSLDLPTGARERLASGKPVLWAVGEGAHPRILLAASISRAAGGFIAGEVKPEYLWGPDDEWPAATEFCVVLESSRRVLHCPAEMTATALRAVDSRAAASSTWARPDGVETFRARSASQFMRGAFGSPDWMVIASQPEGYQLARAVAFSRVYIPVLALALVMVTWLTLRQARNIVAPLTRLAARARGIEANDFNSRLDLARGDEFGELGGAFDQMAARLGRQFASLNALAEIDRLILSTQDMAQVVRIVLQRIDSVVASDFASITLFSMDDPGHARTYFCPPEARASVTMVRHTASDADNAMLQRANHNRVVSWGPEDALSGYLRPLREHGMSTAHLHPITWRGATCGVLVLGYRAIHELTPDEDRSALELADRMAVAVSSAWRDEQIYEQAHFDRLTALPNRLLFEDRLEREVVRAQRESMQFAVLLIDLDHFKNVNDSLGHGYGDEVLREAAQRIGACIRNSDTLCRLGGDEFVVMVTALHTSQEAWLIAETIVAAMSREFKPGDQSCFVSASVGIASFPADGQSVGQLLKCADTAMYRAKAAGRAQAVFFEERMNVETVARATLDRDLRVAMDRGELVLHYQPQLDLRSGAIRGAEALIRWQHPTHGLVSPARFIPLAEETGFIEEIGRWSIERACGQMRAWRLEGLALERIAVNFSPRQFRKRSLVDFVGRCMAEASLPPAALEIEITEGLLAERGKLIEQILRELSGAGHRIALDDFGTGFSSMSYLKRFPVDAIKIDRVFIEGLAPGTDSQAIVAAVIAMSHALGKAVVAEGVETREQLELLRAMGCDEIQGFVLSAAVPPAHFAALLRSWNPAEQGYKSWSVSNTD